jgi:hypothetical protein
LQQSVASLKLPNAAGDSEIEVAPNSFTDADFSAAYEEEFSTR